MEMISRCRALLTPRRLTSENRRTLAVLRGALNRLIGEIQQDLFLSCLTIGELTASWKSFTEYRTLAGGVSAPFGVTPKM
jgi:hypothetical protein